MARHAILVFLLFAAAIAACVEHERLAGARIELAVAARREALLTSENDSLRQALAAAQRKVADAANLLRRGQIERDVASIRDLDFTSPVAYESLDRAGIRQVVARKLSQQYTDQEIQDISTGYSALGLLPPGFPLKQTYIDLLGEQIAAFYDQHEHKLFMFQDASLESAQNRVILAHELTHALQDQNFGLQKQALEIKNNDDRAAAASALIEGDATLVMSQYMVKDMTWKTLADTVGFSVTQSMEQIRKAPRYLREMLVFPYLKGQQFCAAVFARGGFAALSAVYADPPSSTAQILHPEKYFPETRENPIAVPFPDTTFQGAKPLADNVLGEMGCRILFEQSDTAGHADQIAAGWRGDRYLVYDGGNELVWTSIWRSPEAAGAAEKAMCAMCEHRFSLSPVFSYSSDLSISNAAHTARIRLLGSNEVVFILATTKKMSDLLNEQFAGASHG